MDKQILFVAPFTALFDQAQTIIRDQFNDSADKIRVVKADLHECVSIVRQGVENGVEVVISRGGTASLIKEIVDIPVVDIQVTTADILRALQQSAKRPEIVGIAGFESVIYGREDLEMLLGITFYPITLNSEDEAAGKIAQAVQQGVKLIIGDAISAKIASTLGVEGIVIHSGREAICKSLDEARLIARIRREEQEKSALLRMLIDQSADAIIAVDNCFRITLFNSMAEKYFKVSAIEAVGQPLAKILPQLNLHEEKFDDELLTAVQSIQDKSFSVKTSRLYIKNEPIGVIYNLQNIQHIQKLEQNIRRHLSQKGLVARITLQDIIGTSPVCRQLKKTAAKYALTQSTILVTGESGTGKEMLVQSIHNASPRSAGPFVAVNCAAIPEALLESELFGYEEGAFTGARRGGRQGLFELAHGGTLFLDEIAEMPLALQARLLRVLQEKSVMHLGGSGVIPVDVRIIAATNRNLPVMVERQEFRQDLYYRINILRIYMPALKERIEDIPGLVLSMLERLHQINPGITGIDDEALEYLKTCQWPGNIRQLANTVERAMLLSDGPVISSRDMLKACDDGSHPAVRQEMPPDSPDNLARLEQQTLQRVLCEEEFNYSRAAARLGIHRTTLYRKLNSKHHE